MTGRIHLKVRWSKPIFDREREIASYRQISRNVHIAGIVIPKSAFVNHQIGGINEKEAVVLGKGIDQEQSVEDKPRSQSPS